MFNLFRSGDRDGAVALFDEDAVLIYNAPHVERDATQRFRAASNLSGDQFQPELLDLGESDRNAFLIVRIADPPVEVPSRCPVRKQP